MVFAFFCQSVSNTPCRLLFSSVYGDDMQVALSEVGHVQVLVGVSASPHLSLSFSHTTKNTPVDQLREARKDQLMQVIGTVVDKQLCRIVTSCYSIYSSSCSQIYPLVQVACRVQAEYGFRMAAKVTVPRGYLREDTTSREG